MAQVVVIGPNGATTTANDEKRPNEDRSELERLLAGDIPGREGYKNARIQGPLDQNYGGDSPGYQPPPSETTPSVNENVIDTSGNKIIKTVDEYLSMHPELKGRKSARELVQIFIDKWSETGSANQAEDAMYASPLLENAFPGILDTNGVALYTITEYVTEERNYNVALAEAGLNPFLPLLQEKKADLFRNQIDSAEFGARLNEIRNNVIDNPNKETALNVYNQYFSENGQTIAMTDEALLLLAIAPEAGPQLLARNFDITEIGVSASFQDLISVKVLH